MPTAPNSVRTLVGRYDPLVFDARRHRLRIRLVVSADGAWDVVLANGAARIEFADGSPDAVLTAGARPRSARSAAGGRRNRSPIDPGRRPGLDRRRVDEFLRAYLTPAGRAAFYAAARQIYLDEPHGEEGFWPRLRTLKADALFVWGRRDRLVPIAFARHVAQALPRARQVELDCGHVPQIERPRQTHAALGAFLVGGG